MVKRIFWVLSGEPRWCGSTGFAQPERQYLCETRRFQPHGQHQRPHCAADDRGGRTGRAPHARQDDHRTDVGQYGIGLAIVGIVKGYPVEIVMSSAVSVERRKIIRSYGAKVILTPAEEGTDGAIRLARSKVARRPRKIFHARPVCQCG